MLPKKLQQKLDNRTKNNALRTLKTQRDLIDFSSNDYLGFSKSESIFKAASNILKAHNITYNGATGSRLLSGNHKLYDILEAKLCEFHKSGSTLVFNSGYDANIGFFSSVPQRGDVILYDEYIHASIRDGISMSHAKSYKFKHNDLGQLEALLKRVKHDSFFVVTESVFSMDGDTPNLIALTKLCNAHNAHLIIDEAHAIGVFGEKGEGLVQKLNIENDVFARIITFGKALGCHGAAILGSDALKQYLVNFCRSFIYTTGSPPHSIATVLAAFEALDTTKTREALHENINLFKQEMAKQQLQSIFIDSSSAIHCCIVPGNDIVKSVANKLQLENFDVKPILSPTVEVGKERLRFCLHSYNTKTQIRNVLKALKTYIEHE